MFRSLSLSPNMHAVPMQAVQLQLQLLAGSAPHISALGTAVSAACAAMQGALTMACAP